MIHPAPKPPKTEPKPKKELKRSSPVARSGKAIPKINVKAKAKRAVKARKHYASPEYKAAKAVRMKIAGRQCEALHVLDLYGQFVAQLLPGEQRTLHPEHRLRRCPNVHRLSYHETEYGSDLGILREIDGFILCEGDHGYIERTRHPTRSNGRSV